MKHPFKDFVEELARFTVPEDDAAKSRGRRETAASELGTPIAELEESDIIACADYGFLCSELLVLWTDDPKGASADHDARVSPTTYKSGK
jgi:hypothetical protein